MRKKLFLGVLLVAALTCLFAISASAVDIGGIDYSFSGTEATVTANNQSCKLTVVEIPETVTYDGTTYTVAYIAEAAFRNNSVVEKITTPSTISGIGKYAFREMSALTTVTLNANENFKAFDNAEFWGNAALVSIDMSGCKGLTGLGNGGGYDDTFDGCAKLSRVVLPKGINYIGRHVFFNCSSLTEIENLDFTNVTYVGFKAFWGTKIGGDVVLSENATYVGSHAFRGTNITSIVMRAGSESTQVSMDDATFYGCTQLKYAVLPDNIQTVGSYTFSGCSSLEYIVLGGGVTTFSTTDTFSGCGALKAIIYKGSEDEFKALTGISALGTVEYADFKDFNRNALPDTRTVYYNAVTCSECNALLEEGESFKFTDYVSQMGMGQGCTGCDNVTMTETYDPIFTCIGYSASEDGKGNITIGYTVNNDSIGIYQEKSSKTMKYGIYIVVYDVLGENDILNADGTPSNGVLKADMSNGNFSMLTVRVNGIETETQRETKLLIGVYVIASDSETNNISYIEQGTKGENDKYSYLTYNNLVK